MTTSTLTLTSFLLARIAEDEAANDWQVTAEVERCRADGMPGLTEAEVREYWGEQAWWKRRLAECEAKRLLVGRIACPDAPECGDHDCVVVEETWRILATVYADHADYDEAWRP